jgi:predicted exporter
MGKLGQAAPLIRTLATDPSLRGLAHALSLSLEGLSLGRYNLDAMTAPLDTIAAAVEGVRAGRPTAFSWQVLVNGVPAKPADLTSLIDIWPVLDHHAVEPGQAATAAIRRTVTEASLTSNYDASVHLTGTVPLADLQLATLQQGIGLNFAVTGAIILIALWLALRSVRSVLAVAITIFVGLVMTAAIGLLMAGAFNPISVSFAVLFVGLGADFAIQFGVRYRAERHDRGILGPSLVAAARHVGAPLTLAALAAAAGFFAFVPTDYRGVAELGLIAGCGMVVAYIASLTLLPTLLWLFKVPNEPEALGFSALAGADRFLHRHRKLIVVATSVVALAGLPFLFRLQSAKSQRRSDRNLAAVEPGSAICHRWRRCADVTGRCRGGGQTGFGPPGSRRHPEHRRFHPGRSAAETANHRRCRRRARSGVKGAAGAGVIG